MRIEQNTEPRRELTDEERAAQLDALLNSEPLPMIQKSIGTETTSASVCAERASVGFGSIVKTEADVVSP
jgi:hypothetical protein